MLSLMPLPESGLIILNAWYGKFVTDNSRKHERAKVIDVTVPLQCLVKDSKLILTEATKVSPSVQGKISKPTKFIQNLYYKVDFSAVLIFYPFGYPL